MRLLICAGGTGGGVYPALAVLQALKNHPEAASELSVLWIGSEGGMEKDLVERAGIPFETIPAAGVHGVGIKALPGNVLRLVRGYKRAKELLEWYAPQVMLFTGGYVAVPVALAGRLIPSLLYIPDIEPGLALKVLARFANRIALTVEESMQYFRKKTRLKVVGFPTRSDLQSWSKQSAMDLFGLKSDLPVLLVFGGSSGARSINRALIQVLPELLEEMQIIHITGKLDWDEVSRAKDELASSTRLQASQISRYLPFAYLHEEMGAAFSAADLVVSRAGASILGEFPLFGLPALLIPYPHAWRYQQVNAEYLAERGAAVILADQDLAGKLLNQVRLLIHDRAGLKKMRDAMSALARKEAASEIAGMLVEIAGEGSQKRINP